MSTDERNRMRRIASNVAEEDRRKQLGSAADKRRDIEETLGTDVVNQAKLVTMADGIWRSVPVSQRDKFTAADWQKAIHERCTSALARAEEKLEENKTDDRMFTAKVKILRQTFASQVVRAMQEVSEGYRKASGIDTAGKK